VTANFPSAAEAAIARLDIQSIGGSRLEGDGGFLYVIIDHGQVAEAVADLRGAGFKVDVGLCTYC
jgi:hypothetical protein